MKQIYENVAHHVENKCAYQWVTQYKSLENPLHLVRSWTEALKKA